MSVCLIVLNYWNGLIVSLNFDLHETQVRDLGAAFGLPIIGGFTYFILPHIIAIAHLETQKNARSCGLTSDESSQITKRICEIPILILVFSLVAGFLVTFSYLYTEGLFYVEDLGPEANLRRTPLVLQAWWMWTGICLSIAIILRNTKIIDEFIVKHLTIELFKSAHVLPFTNAIFRNALFISIGLSLVPILWIGGEPQFKDCIFAIAVLLIFINLTFYPLLRMKQIKSSTIESVQAVNHFEWPLPNPAVSDGFEKLTMQDRELILSDAKRMQKQTSKNWSNGFQFLTRITILISIPLLTWSGFQLLNSSLI